MLPTFALYDDKNNLVETFAGPHRLSEWNSLPDNWTIEEFWGDISRGSISLESVKELAEVDKLTRDEFYSFHKHELGMTIPRDIIRSAGITANAYDVATIWAGSESMNSSARGQWFVRINEKPTVPAVKVATVKSIPAPVCQTCKGRCAIIPGSKCQDCNDSGYSR